MKNDIISYCDYYYMDNRKDVEKEASKFMDDLRSSDVYKKLIEEYLTSFMLNISRSNNIIGNGILDQITIRNNIEYDAITQESIV